MRKKKPTASEEKSPMNYHPSPTSPGTPSALLEAYLTPKPFPQTRQATRKNKNNMTHILEEEQDTEQCNHAKTTRRETNAFISVEKCLKCGRRFRPEKKKKYAPETKVKLKASSIEEKPDIEQEKEKEKYMEFLEYQKWKGDKDKQ